MSDKRDIVAQFVSLMVFILVILILCFGAAKVLAAPGHLYFPVTDKTDCKRYSIVKVITANANPVGIDPVDVDLISTYEYDSQLTGKTRLIIAYKCEEE
jgi:hypothetical protein